MRDIDRRTVKRLMGHGATDAEIEEAVQAIMRLAFEEWIDWISGAYRPLSISENTADRVLRIYAEVIGDFPDIGGLVEVFNMPVGRARYLVSVLKYGNQPAFKRMVRRKLQAELTQVIEGKADDADVTPFFRKVLLDELDSLDVELKYEDPAPGYESFTKLRGPASIGLECRMTVATTKKLLDRLTARLEAEES